MRRIQQGLLALALSSGALAQDPVVVDGELRRSAVGRVQRALEKKSAPAAPLAPPPPGETMPEEFRLPSSARSAMKDPPAPPQQVAAPVAAPRSAPPAPVRLRLPAAVPTTTMQPTPTEWDYVLTFWCALNYWFWLSLVRICLCLVLKFFGLWNPEFGWAWAFLWPWRILYWPLFHLFRFLRTFRHGERATAKWTPTLEVFYLLFRPGQILFGKARAFSLPLLQYVSWKIERHIVLLGATAAGKTSWLISVLALCKGNVFVIDCAAQFINTIGRRLGAGARGILGRGRDVRVIDPYGLAKYFTTSCWNVFRQIDQFVALHGPDEKIGFVLKVAEALIKPELNPANEWVSNDARCIVAGVILYIYERYPLAEQNLITLRRLVARGLDPHEVRALPGSKPGKPHDGLKLLYNDMKSLGGAIANAAVVMESGFGSDGKNPPRSAVTAQTIWLDLPQMQKIVGGESHFDLHDMKTGKLCLFICAPVSDIRGTLSGFFRLTTVLTMEIFRRLDKVHLKHSMTLIADELPALGHVEVIQEIGPEGRKHGIRLLAVAQDLEGLQRSYPSGWKGFLSNADARVIMSTVDKDTIAYIAACLGTATHKEKVDAGWMASLFSRIMVRGQKVERPLLYDSQIEDILHPDAKNVFVLRYGRPMVLKIALFYRELPVYMYEHDPHYRQTPGRWVGRKLCERLIPGPAPAVTIATEK